MNWNELKNKTTGTQEHDINRTIIQMTKWGILFTYLSEINKLIRPKYLERI